jgi:hypothetical protein
MLNKNNSNSKKPSTFKIVIEGVTLAGAPFRPSDWAERIGGSLSTFKNQRIYYSPLLKPSYKEGNRCLIVDPKLQEKYPALYKHILDFAAKNNLRVNQVSVEEKKG